MLLIAYDDDTYQGLLSNLQEDEDQYEALNQLCSDYEYDRVCWNWCRIRNVLNEAIG